MNFGIPLELKTDESRLVLRTRLAKAIAVPPSPWPLKPDKISDWLAQYRGKTFIGKVESDQFKMALLDQTSSGRFKSGGSVIIEGTIEDGTVHANLRPKLFHLIFVLFWFTCAWTGLLLSFHGPSNTATVHWLLTALLILPLAIWAAMFAFEVRLASRAFRRVFLETGSSDI